MHYFALYLVHIMTWFCFAGFVSVIRGKSQVIQWSSAAALGLVSGTLHIILIQMEYLHK